MAKTIRSLADLEPFGIQFLTGEACRLGLRALCDVSEDGLHLLRETLGFADVRLQDPWNSGTIGGKPRVGSVLIPYDLVPTLAVVGLIGGGAREVLITQTSGVVGIFGDYGDDEAEVYARFDEQRGHSPRRIRLANVPGQGTRATHQMSGRTE